jgi:hypothetical protein
MPNYQLGKIYKLWSPSKNIIYIGSTTQTLSRRLSKHLGDYKANTNNKSYSYLVLECEDYKIELLEEYPCNNRQQLEQKEGEYIKNNICCNKNGAGITKQERDTYIKEYNKQYYTNNKEYHKEYNKNNKERNTEYMKKYLEEYNEANKEKLREYRKQYYQKKKGKAEEVKS